MNKLGISNVVKVVGILKPTKLISSFFVCSVMPNLVRLRLGAWLVVQIGFCVFMLSCVCATLLVWCGYDSVSVPNQQAAVLV